MENENNVHSTNVSSFASFKELLPDVLNKVAEMNSHERSLWGLSTGFSDIDNVLLGLNQSDLIVLASRPSMGKTSLALNIALNVAGHPDKTVAFFSLVTSKEQLTMDLLSMEALVNTRYLKKGELAEANWEQIASAIVSISQMNILIDDNPMLTVEDMSGKCQHMDNLKLVIVDDLQFITSADGNQHADVNRYETVSAILRRLKVMARELNVPLLCLSQLNRANEKRDDKRPQLSDLRDSGFIEEYADIVMFLYRDDYYHEDSEEHNVAECIIAKNRHGETGTVYLKWLPEYTMFATMETESQHDKPPRTA